VIYHLLSGGSTLQESQRLRHDEVPHATTLGRFLWRFGDRCREAARGALKESRETTERVQQDAFALLPRDRRPGSDAGLGLIDR
jgi:hypothetical protein